MNRPTEGAALNRIMAQEKFAEEHGLPPVIERAFPNFLMKREFEDDNGQCWRIYLTHKYVYTPILVLKKMWMDLGKPGTFVEFLESSGIIYKKYRLMWISC